MLKTNIKTFLFTFIILVIILLSGCSSNREEALASDFFNHFKTYYECNDSSTIISLSFSSEKLSFGFPTYETEEVDYGTYHIIASMGTAVNNCLISKQILSISLTDLKKEMRYFADAFIDYAKIENMDNDYYLYIEYPYHTDYHIECRFLYDYEKDILYLPEKYDLLCEMYSKFGTIRKDEIIEKEEGINWLVENGFGKIKHKEFERYYLDSPFAYIDKEEGKFKTYDLDFPFIE